jgi:alpha-galactosidase
MHATPASAPESLRATDPSTVRSIRWGHPSLTIEFCGTDSDPVAITAVESDGARYDVSHTVPLVEILTAGAGHVPASSRLIGSAVGADLRLTTFEMHQNDVTFDLTLELRSKRYDVAATVSLTSTAGTPAVRATVDVKNTGDTALVLRSVTSLACGLGVHAGGDVRGDWCLTSGSSDWLGEGRWSTTPLVDLLPRLEERLTGHNPRNSHQVSSQGTWSTKQSLPFAAVASAELGRCWMWQIEHNGPWRWDVGQDTAGLWFAASGPTEVDAGWTKSLAPGDVFTTVPASLTIGKDLESAVAAMTRHRRELRRPHRDNEAMTVVFNDYMNTLDGDPTTDRLLPLVAAAAAAGAEVFCIDAGWYDETGDWWDSVGAWEPSRTRFPQGLGEVIDRIRELGMVPGLWLEPEVIGVASPLADVLPDEAFMSLGGQRLVEHHRYHLDLRNEAAVAHLDAVIDRLVADFGIGFFKFDYNIDPGAGPTRGADSAGDGLLSHNRAHLAWLESILDRHPGLVIENCASGAMRMDPALMRRLAMQSTSDQQDHMLFPAIAASAPMSILPEQAASWAYPQPGMNRELVGFCLVTSLLGRYYVSGFLNRMDQEEVQLVHEAIAVAKELRSEIPEAFPSWPSGLPKWDDPWISLALRLPDSTLLSVWRRGGPDHFTMRLPAYAGCDLTVTTVFPERLDAWDVTWSASEGLLEVKGTPDQVSARTFRLQPRANHLGTTDTPDHSEPGAAHKGASR